MDRRTFIKLTGVVAAGTAISASARDWQSVPAAQAAGPRLAIAEPGTYLVSGVVRLESPVVEITGISNSQSMSWSVVKGSAAPVSSFMSFERYERPGQISDIRVRGGRLESLSAVLVEA
jgi:hypothetical protein